MIICLIFLGWLVPILSHHVSTNYLGAHLEHLISMVGLRCPPWITKTHSCHLERSGGFKVISRHYGKPNSSLCNTKTNSYYPPSISDNISMFLFFRETILKTLRIKLKYLVFLTFISLYIYNIYIFIHIVFCVFFALILKILFLFTWLAVSGLNCSMQTLSCGMW